MGLDLTFNIRLMDQTNHQYAENPNEYGFLHNKYITVFYDDLFAPEFDIRYKGECIARPYLLHKHFILRPILKFSDHNQLNNSSEVKGDYPWDMYFKTNHDLLNIPEIIQATTPEQVRDKFLEIISVPDYNTLPNDYQKYLRLYYSKNIDEITLSQTDEKYKNYKFFSSYRPIVERFINFNQKHNLNYDEYLLHFQQFKVPRFFGQFILTEITRDNIEFINIYNNWYDNVKTSYGINDNNYIIAYELICYNDFYTIPKGTVIQSNVIHIKLAKTPQFLFKIEDFSNSKMKFSRLFASNDSPTQTSVYMDKLFENEFDENIQAKFFKNKYANHKLFKYFINYDNKNNTRYLWLFDYSFAANTRYSINVEIYNKADAGLGHFYTPVYNKCKGVTVVNEKEKNDIHVLNESILNFDFDFDKLSNYNGKPIEYWENIFLTKNILLKRPFLKEILNLDNIFKMYNGSEFGYQSGNLPIQNSFTFYEYFLDDNNYEIVDQTTFKDIKIQHQTPFEQDELSTIKNGGSPSIIYKFTKLAHVLNQIQPYLTEYSSGTHESDALEFGNIIYKDTLLRDDISFTNILLNNRQQSYTAYVGADEFTGPIYEHFKPSSRNGSFINKITNLTAITTINYWISKPKLPKRVFTKTVWKQKEEDDVVTRKIVFNNNKLNTEITIKIDNSKDYVILVY